MRNRPLSSHSANELPTPHRVRRGARVALVIAASAGGAGLAMLGGCDRDDASKQAVVSGARDLHALAGGGAAPAIPALQKDTYTRVVGTVQPVADSGSPGTNAAASLILAQSQFGLSEAPAARMAELERESLNRLTVLRATLNQWTTQMVAAEADASYSTTELIGVNNQRIAELEQQITAANKAQADLEARVALLRKQAQARIEQAEPHQLAYAELRQQAGTLNAVAGMSVVEQAAARKRQGDQLMNEAAALTAQADVLQPQADEAALQARQLANQKSSLEQSNVSLAAGETAAKDQAAKAREEARKAEADLLGQLDELRKLRAGPLAEATADTLNALQKAVTSVRKAQTDSAPQAKVAIGSYQQAIGDINLQAASGHRQFAAFLHSLANVKPAFPGAAGLGEESVKIKESEKAALDAAKAAYEEANSAYSGVPVRGEVKERLQKVGETLDVVSKWVSGEAVDVSGILKVRAAEASVAPSPDSPTSEPVAAATGDEAEIRQIIARVLDAGRTGNTAGVRELYLTSSPEEAAFVDASIAFQSAFGQLEQATQKAFGEGLIAALARNPMLAQVKDTLAAAQSASAADFQIVVSGDSATASSSSAPIPMEFARSNGQWKVLTQYDTLVAALPEAQRGLLTRQFEVMATSAQGALADLNSGVLKSADAVVNSFMLKLQPAMMQIMQEQMQQGGAG